MYVCMYVCMYVSVCMYMGYGGLSCNLKGIVSWVNY
jgi:hypothetical protein